MSQKDPSPAGPSPTTPPIVDLHRVCMEYPRPEGDALKVLDHVDLALHEGEILGLLGRSGSGKSTLLRIAGGLIAPTGGTAKFQGQPITRPCDGVAIVFQTFDLFPWLTVRQNVEAGLDALGVPAAEARKRATDAIGLIGLKGFEDAYPRELSGGMRQRVGFARATVINPVVLLMDEPFSALDVLTAETLRTDFLDLWAGKQFPTKAVMIVTHNIEEAVLMCDRILVLASNPGHIALELPVDLAQPRDRQDPAFRDLVDEIYATLTARRADAIAANRAVHGGLAQPLPATSPRQIEALCETLDAAPFDGQAAVKALVAALAMPLDHVLPLAEALHILEFGELTAGRLRLTAAGRVFAKAERDMRRRLFAEHLMRFVPLAAHVLRILAERADNSAPIQRFETELEDHLAHTEAKQTMHTLVAWGLYAGRLEYEYRTRMVRAVHA